MRRKFALCLAIMADATQWLITPLFVFAGLGEVFDTAIDVTMAVALTLLRGFHWAYLPAFVAELIPGVNLVPLWTATVLLTWKAGGPGKVAGAEVVLPVQQVSAPNQLPAPNAQTPITTMNNRNITGIAISLAILIVAFAFAVKVVPQIGKTVGVPAYLMEQAIAAVKSWGGVNVTITSRSDTIEVKPVKELVLSRMRIRSIVTYTNSSWGSEKKIIADQSFDARFGWNLADDVQATLMPDKKTIQVSVASGPKLLNLAPVEVVPETLYSSNGIFNGLTPADQDEVIKELHDAALTDTEVNKGLAVAKEQFEKFFEGIFLAQGFTCVFEYGAPDR